MHTVASATARVGGHSGKERRVGDAEAHFLALHIAARMRQRRTLLDSLQQWIAPGFRPVRRSPTDKEERGHGGKDSPPVALRAGHSAKRTCKTPGVQKNGHYRADKRARSAVVKG